VKPKPIAYPPGWFTELIRLHNWPPGFVSALDREKPEFKPHVTTDEQRERQIAAGYGWGSGTVPMPGTPKRRAPGWMR